MSNLTRRGMLAAGSAAGLGLARGGTVKLAPGKPALLGGTPLFARPSGSWPIFDEKEEKALAEVVRSGHWFRGNGDNVKRFEETYAQLAGTKHCLATSSGTAALQTSLAALGVGPGDEVLLAPYTFVATLNVILNMYALPVFVDSDIETAQIDARKIDAAITKDTVAMIPVHLAGNVADLDEIMKVAKARKIPVVEDTCQSHLSEWRGKKAGSYGATGCFSFQASKNLNCGEGGAIITNDDDLYEKCFAYHWNGTGQHNKNYVDVMHGTKFLMTEFQAAVLSTQLERLEKQTQHREQNARYLTSMLKEIPGIHPAAMYPGCTRNVYHGLIFRYNKEHFAGMPKEKFLKALGAEHVPAGDGYDALNKRRYLKNALNSRGYQRIYSKQRLAQLEERNQLPVNDRLCQEVVWVSPATFVSDRAHMEQIAEAILRIQKHAGEVARA
ncbi:MAG: DegT/DnrJ/EryC1/StrS family aminotransferase [Bryobacteraceae bacterium]